MIANCNRDPKQHARPFTAKQFHPDYATDGKLRITGETLSTLAALLGVTPEQERAAFVQAEQRRQQAAEIAARQRLRIARCA